MTNASTFFPSPSYFAQYLPSHTPLLFKKRYLLARIPDNRAFIQKDSKFRCRHNITN